MSLFMFICKFMLEILLKYSYIEDLVTKSNKSNLIKLTIALVAGVIAMNAI